MPEGREEERPRLIFGVHPVTELVRARRGDVERLFVAREHGARLGRLLREARRAGIPVSYLSRDLLARKIGGRAAHQGIAAQVAPFPYADVESLCRQAAAHEDAVLVLVDRVADAGNLGAILRTAAAAGVQGVILATEGTAGVVAGAVKASAGAVERVPVAREARPSRRVAALRAVGFRAAALDPRGATLWDQAPLEGRLLVVVGGEARGPRPGVLRECDVRVAIPLARGVESLNVAVSLGVLLFEAVRRRRSAP